MNTHNQSKLSQKKDCILCKITGCSGLLAISGYLFYNSNKTTNKLNKNFVNVLATGIHYLLLFLSGFHFQ